MSGERSAWVIGGRGHAEAIDLGDFYAAHYLPMVRLAGFMLGGSDGAADIAQEAFIQLAVSVSTLRDPDKAVAYLRKVVVNGCRGVHRHGQVVDRYDAIRRPHLDVDSAETSALAAFDRHMLVAALSTLPRRRREAVVLRHYCDLSEATVAETLGISVGAVKSLTSRGLTDLAKALQGRR